MTAASAFSPNSAEPGAADSRASEPSMEDILASIRRIIADDHTASGKSTPANGARRPPVGRDQEEDGRVEASGARGAEQKRSSYDEILDLARSGETSGRPVVPSYQSAPATAFAPLEPARYETAEAEEASVDEERATERRELDEHDAGSTGSDYNGLVPVDADHGDESLLSAPLGASVMSSFEALAATVVLQNTPMLESIMRDQLRPMIKAWLDDNLPTLVERLVRLEIERVARGTRG